MVSHEGSVCLKGVQKWKKLCEYLFGYICKAFGLLIQTDLVQASTLLYHFEKITGYYFKIKYMYSLGHIFFKKHF